MWQIEVAGRAAAAALATGHGVVRASFGRSCYLECSGSRWVCIGAAAIGRGPLNALVDAFIAPRIGDTLQVTLRHAALWQPEAPAGAWTEAAALRLRQLAQERIPQEGLAGLLTGVSTPLIEHARRPLESFEQWLRGARGQPDADALIGLGPGLTPSGDDYFGGAMVALHACGRAERARQLWAWLEPKLPGATHAISAAHLAAAAEGEGHELLHACLAALLQGQELEAPLVRLSALGHCSGWDALAGAVAAAAATTATAATTRR